MFLLVGEGKGNNYAYLVTDEPTKESVIIDPANPPEYVHCLVAGDEEKESLTGVI